jgi:hypothetical protein
VAYRCTNGAPAIGLNDRSDADVRAANDAHARITRRRACHDDLDLVAQAAAECPDGSGADASADADGSVALAALAASAVGSGAGFDADGTHPRHRLELGEFSPCRRFFQPRHDGGLGRECAASPLSSRVSRSRFSRSRFSRL